MNKDDIKKALECCSNPSVNSCKDCPYANNGKFSCRDGEMFKDTLDLIAEQENEIEYRKKQYDNQIAENTRLHIEYDKAFERLKAQQREIDRLKLQLGQANAGIVNCSGCELVETNAVKEFAEKVKEYINSKVIADFGDSESVKYYTIDLDEFEGEIDERLREYEK